ncbi:MAG: Hpt domain-containing protein [Methylococcaceae bacterium]|nr:Hpt domain-containing protein [Methylococcaceae bacterium]
MSIWDATAALENLDGDSDLLDEMIALFLVEGPKHLSELSRFQAEGNLSALANTAHAIKGAVGHFYVNTAKECASLLEQTARSGQSADYQGMTDALINAVTDLINNLRLAKNSTNPGK